MILYTMGFSHRLAEATRRVKPQVLVAERQARKTVAVRAPVRLAVIFNRRFALSVIPCKELSRPFWEFVTGFFGRHQTPIGLSPTVRRTRQV